MAKNVEESLCWTVGIRFTRRIPWEKKKNKQRVLSGKVWLFLEQKQIQEQVWKQVQKRFVTEYGPDSRG